MPTSCVFELDRLNTIYGSGEYISGRILLTTSRAKRVNAIFVTLDGEAKVMWTINGRTAEYFGHQEYLHTRINVVRGSTEFAAGTHVYALMLRIPPSCPSSCKGPYGFIAYCLSLTIDHAWSLNEVFHKRITVVQPLNLNFNPEYGRPVRDEKVKYLCHWPCSSGIVSTTLILLCPGVVPTQRLNFYLEVDNQSPHYDVVGVEAALIQHFVFLAHKPFKRNYFSRPLVKLAIGERTLRLTKRPYEGSVCVPADTPRSTLNPRYIVYLHYTLQVTLKTGIFHCDSIISVPVVVGTVPVTQESHSSPAHGSITAQPTLRREPLRPVSTAMRYQPLRDEVRELPMLEENEADELQRSDDEDAHQQLDDDEPPSYDSCMPPSFSFATLSSQQTMDSQSNERQRIFVKLPQFPAYSTLAASTQAVNMTVELPVDDLRRNMPFNSYGSLDTDQQGRSLDTFSSSCGILSESDEYAEEESM